MSTRCSSGQNRPNLGPKTVKIEASAQKSLNILPKTHLGPPNGLFMVRQVWFDDLETYLEGFLC